jgi:hypothetical protein
MVLPADIDPGWPAGVGPYAAGLCSVDPRARERVAEEALELQGPVLKHIAEIDERLCRWIKSGSLRATPEGWVLRVDEAPDALAHRLIVQLAPVELVCSSCVDALPPAWLHADLRRLVADASLLDEATRDALTARNVRIEPLG